ncbi:MAG TPA: carbohydrate porin [Gemmatimonadales bacterium]|nr:carbohydrate porin [Gemmatimonadales bacterium]
MATVRTQFLAFALAIPRLLTAQAPQPLPSAASSDSGDPSPRRWNVHFQNTDIAEFAAPFGARYSGPHSLRPGGEVSATISADLFVGRRVWRGGELHADLLLWQGSGLSTSFGVQNFPDADAYKAATRAPNYMFAHLYLQEVIGFGGGQERVADGPMALAGSRDVSRLTLMLGRMTPLDLFDHNRYAGDGHTQFMSWAGTANTTWDYGQNTIGYETGLAAELNQRDWAVRYSFFLMPPYVNTGNVGSGDGGDDRVLTWPPRGRYGPIAKSWAQAAEWERRFAIGGHPGAIRVLGWLDEAKTVDYDVAASVLRTLGPNTDLTPYEAYHESYGLGLNAEQELTPTVGVFARVGWNDGRSQALEFTDTNWLLSLGGSFSGALWRRPRDTMGIAVFLAGASPANQRYLAAGGLGIVSGDGALTYGVERSLTPYYDFAVTRAVHLGAQYQLTVDPNFNRDRGPASTFMLRLHVED